MKKFGKRLLSATLMSALVVSSLTMAGCSKTEKKGGEKGGSGDEMITLDVFSQLANYSGIQQGWSADLLKEKFNVELNIIPDQDGVYETRMQEKSLGDIVIFGATGAEYQQAIEQGVLFDWEEDDILADYGPNITKYMSTPLEYNRKLTAELTGDENNKTLYGFAGEVGGDSQGHAEFMYSWDVRWDLYKELGYPEIKDMEDFKQLFIDMKKICPKDDNGNETYAISMWPDWDGDMVMYVKCLASTYYGYDGDKGLGLYDPQTGKFYDTLMEDGPYLNMLKWTNELFREKLVDPDSMTTTYNKMFEKVNAGGAFFSVFNYSGSDCYNTAKHLKAGKMMKSLRPADARPIVYGLKPAGGTHVYAIGADTAYPEKCMEIIDYLCTPEGFLNFEYGPKGEFWDYDENGDPYMTEIGAACQKDLKTDISQTGHSGTFKDGQQQWNNITWARDAKNPESASKEPFNQKYWKSTLLADEYDIQKDWREHTGADTPNEYFELGDYRLFPGVSYDIAPRETEFETTWTQVTKAITDYSWKAIYSKNDAEFQKNVDKMIKEANDYGYEECKKWSIEEAEKRWACTLEEYPGPLEGREGAEAVEAEKQKQRDEILARKSGASTTTDDAATDDATTDDAAAAE